MSLTQSADKVTGERANHGVTIQGEAIKGHLV